ncbi:MAG: hypothetical protein ABII90_00925 [Bacteroidota bacterium]
MKKLEFSATILCCLIIIYGMARCNNDKEPSALQEKQVQLNLNPTDTSDKVRNIIETAKSAPVAKVSEVNEQIPQKIIDDCIDILQKSNMVYATFVGRGGLLTKETWAFNIILSSKNRIGIFRTLLETGSNAGKSYAVCGLYLTSANEFVAAKTKYIEKVFEIHTMIGCVGYPASNQEFLTVVESGYITRVMVLKKVNLKYKY